MTLVKVEFEWDNQWGKCYDCGLPAAYISPLRYGESGTTGPWGPEHLLCSVDAAMAASEGEEIYWLFTDDNPFGQCDHDGIVYEAANNLDHCSEEGVCWTHCTDRIGHKAPSGAWGALEG